METRKKKYTDLDIYLTTPNDYNTPKNNYLNEKKQTTHFTEQNNQTISFVEGESPKFSVLKDATFSGGELFKIGDLPSFPVKNTTLKKSLSTKNVESEIKVKEVVPKDIIKTLREKVIAETKRIEDERLLKKEETLNLERQKQALEKERLERIEKEELLKKKVVSVKNDNVNEVEVKGEKDILNYDIWITEEYDNYIFYGKECTDIWNEFYEKDKNDIVKEDKDIKLKCFKTVQSILNRLSGTNETVNSAIKQANYEYLNLINSSNENQKNKLGHCFNYTLFKSINNNVLQSMDNLKIWSYSHLIYGLKNYDYIYKVLFGLIIYHYPVIMGLFNINSYKSNKIKTAELDSSIFYIPMRKNIINNEYMKRLTTFSKIYLGILVIENNADTLWRIWARVLMSDIPIAMIICIDLLNITGFFMFNIFKLNFKKFISRLKTIQLPFWTNQSETKNSTQEEKNAIAKIKIILEEWNNQLIDNNATLKIPEGFTLPDCNFKKFVEIQ